MNEQLKTGQGENEENLQFLQRVDEYQYRRGLKRVEACREIGISEGRLSEIRNGKASVSGRMWQKLKIAEGRTFGRKWDAASAKTALASMGREQRSDWLAGMLKEVVKSRPLDEIKDTCEDLLRDQDFPLRKAFVIVMAVEEALRRLEEEAGNKLADKGVGGETRPRESEKGKT